jgi:hypothetical protein
MLTVMLALAAPVDAQETNGGSVVVTATMVTRQPSSWARLTDGEDLKTYNYPTLDSVPSRRPASSRGYGKVST